ncbi:MAG: sulfotransferase domain-containing protein [Cyclobacteriaceae bacterium]|nr:sulfotransferase domain-containing protein [Cyclobacteriaceae bacterium]
MLVIVCGMPRSGSTLQFNITWELVSRLKIGQKVEWREGQDIIKNEEKLAQLCDDKSISIIKSHNLEPIHYKLAEMGKSIKFLYSYRDLRDVVYSLKRKFDYSTTKALTRINSSIETEQSLTNYASQVLKQDYQVLRYSLEKAITEIGQFLNLNADKNLVNDIFNELNIDVAFEKSRAKKIPFEHFRRKLAILFRRPVKFADEHHMYHPNHVSRNKGESGQWKENLTQDEISEIDSRFGDWLVDKGYSKSQ